MKVQNQRHLGQSVGFAILFLGMALAMVTLMVVESGGFS